MTSTDNRPVQVIHNSSERQFSNLAGERVGTAKESLKGIFGIPDAADSFVNGNRTSLHYRLQAGDVLEFIKFIGRKGLGQLMSPSEVMEAWGIDSKQYEAWIAEGLPTEPLVDGSTAHFEAALDEWSRGRIRIKPGKTPPPLRSKWLRLKDAAALIGVSTKQLARVADQGGIGHKRKPGRGRGGRGEYLFSQEEVEKFNARTTLPANIDKHAVQSRRPILKSKVFIDPKKCGRMVPS